MFGFVKDLITKRSCLQTWKELRDKRVGMLNMLYTNTNPHMTETLKLGLRGNGVLLSQLLIADEDLPKRVRKGGSKYYHDPNDCMDTVLITDYDEDAFIRRLKRDIDDTGEIQPHLDYKKTISSLDDVFSVGLLSQIEKKHSTLISKKLHNITKVLGSDVTDDLYALPKNLFENARDYLEDMPELEQYECWLSVFVLLRCFAASFTFRNGGDWIEDFPYVFGCSYVYSAKMYGTVGIYNLEPVIVEILDRLEYSRRTRHNAFQVFKILGLVGESECE